MEQIGADRKAIGRTEPGQRQEFAGPEFALAGAQLKQRFAIVEEILHCRPPAGR
jgi:hypothetical protein